MSKITKVSFFNDENEKRLNKISITYLERIVDGIHPVYNTPMLEESVMTDENVKRCFSFVLDMLKRLNASEESNSKLPKENSNRKTYNEKNGLPDHTCFSWTPEEEQQLIREYNEGMRLDDIAAIHKRTRGAISSRVKKLGLRH